MDVLRFATSPRFAWLLPPELWSEIQGYAAHGPLCPASLLCPTTLLCRLTGAELPNNAANMMLFATSLLLVGESKTHPAAATIERLAAHSKAEGRLLIMGALMYLNARDYFAANDAIKYIKKVVVSDNPRQVLRIGNFGALYGVPILVFDRCYLPLDITRLGGHERLEIIHCEGVTDLTAVRRVPYLKLEDTDVEELAEMENDTLIVRDCMCTLKDISRLGRVRRLTIDRHIAGFALRGMSALANVADSVSLTHLWVDLAALRGIRKVSLTRCSLTGGAHGVRSAAADLGALCDAQRVHLSGCAGVIDVSPLKGARRVSLSSCAGVTDVSPLGGVRSVSLSDCPNVGDVSPLRGVHTLTLVSLKAKGFSLLGGHHALTISSCNERRRLSRQAASPNRSRSGSARPRGRPATACTSTRSRSIPCGACAASTWRRTPRRSAGCGTSGTPSAAASTASGRAPLAVFCRRRIETPPTQLLWTPYTSPRRLGSCRRSCGVKS